MELKQQTLGQLRLQSDLRQIGGLMMLLGSAAMIFPMANLATLIGPNGTTASQGIALSSLIASIFVIFFGIASILVGYLQAIHDYGNVYLTGFLLCWAQLAWLPFLTDLTAVGTGARSGAAFIPEAYEPSATDVKFVGAMGMLGILGYGTGFLGSLSLTHFALYAFQNGKPQDRNGKYYGGRLTFYAFANFVVGAAQVLLGAYILARFGSGELAEGPIVVAMFVVHFPEISIAVGSIQLINAIYGLGRSVGFHGGANDHTFQATTLAAWICTIVLQIMVQIAYAPGDAAAAAAPSVTMITLGISVIVAFLDFKMRTTPDTLPADYYYSLIAQGAVDNEKDSIDDSFSEGEDENKNAQDFHTNQV